MDQRYPVLNKGKMPHEAAICCLLHTFLRRHRMAHPRNRSVSVCFPSPCRIQFELHFVLRFYSPSAMRTISVMDRKRSAAARAGPLLPLLLQESIHSFFPDHPQVLQWRFPMRILRSIAILLFHYILAGIIRTFIAIPISVLSPFPAEYDPAVPGTEFRLVVVRSIASLTRIILN